MSVFIDTSAILAIFDADDHRHKKASDVWRSIVESDEVLHTSNYVIVETMALLQNRFGSETARRFNDEMVPVLSVYWVDKPIHDVSVAATLAWSGKGGPSLVDCVSLEVIRKLGLAKVFVYDRHFNGKGCNLIS